MKKKGGYPLSYLTRNQLYEAQRIVEEQHPDKLHAHLVFWIKAQKNIVAKLKKRGVDPDFFAFRLEYTILMRKP